MAFISFTMALWGLSMAIGNPIQKAIDELGNKLDKPKKVSIDYLSKRVVDLDEEIRDLKKTIKEMNART